MYLKTTKQLETQFVLTDFIGTHSYVANNTTQNSFTNVIIDLKYITKYKINN